MTSDWLRGVWKRARALLLRRRVERELGDELAFHLVMEIERNVARGLTAAEARRAAAVSFGGHDRWAERVRDVRNYGWLEALTQDARQAWRGYLRAPGFALAAVVTLALGIGGVTAVFGVVDAVLLRPLPFPEPDRLVHVWETNPEGSDFSAADANYLDFAASGQALESLGAFRPDALAFGAAGGEQVRALAASHSLLGLLGAEAALGRTFTADEDRVGGATQVAVVSDAFWRRRFGADRGVLGRTVLLQGTPHEVIGVFGPDVRFVDADLWIPLAADPSGDRTDHWLSMVGRLAPGAGGWPTAARR